MSLPVFCKECNKPMLVSFKDDAYLPKDGVSEKCPFNENGDSKECLNKAIKCDPSFGDKLKIARRLFDLNLREFCQKIDSIIPMVEYSRYENSYKEPDEETKQKIFEFIFKGEESRRNKFDLFELIYLKTNFRYFDYSCSVKKDSQDRIKSCKNVFNFQSKETFDLNTLHKFFDNFYQFLHKDHDLFSVFSKAKKIGKGFYQGLPMYEIIPNFRINEPPSTTFNLIIYTERELFKHGVYDEVDYVFNNLLLANKQENKQC